MPKKILRELQIRRNWCKGCRICVEFCPKQALALDEHDKAYVAHREQCNCCQLCEFRCPDLAIKVIFDTEGRAT